MNLLTNDENLVKIDQGIRPCEAILFENFGKIFILGGYTATSPPMWGEILRGGVVQAKFHPSVQRASPLSNRNTVYGLCR